MSLNPWLITWEIVNKSNPVPENLIAAIIPGYTGSKEVKRMMLVLFFNHGGCIVDQVTFATKRHGYQVLSVGVSGKFQLGSSPYLLARRVFNFEVQRDENYDEIAVWEDREPDLTGGGQDERRRPTHFWQRKHRYEKSTNVINCENPTREEYRFPKKIIPNLNCVSASELLTREVLG